MNDVRSPKNSSIGIFLGSKQKKAPISSYFFSMSVNCSLSLLQVPSELERKAWQGEGRGREGVRKEERKRRRREGEGGRGREGGREREGEGGRVKEGGRRGREREAGREGGSEGGREIHTNTWDTLSHTNLHFLDEFVLFALRFGVMLDLCLHLLHPFLHTLHHTLHGLLRCCGDISQSCDNHVIIMWFKPIHHYQYNERH